jgi:uncharacterized damage-inducible protein DinB
MKCFFRTTVVLLSLLTGAVSVSATPMTKLERARLVSHLEMTQSWLLDEVSKLSPEQLHFRAAPGKWSVLDVVEHLKIAEPIYWQQLKDALKVPPPDKKPQITDADILWYGVDRTQRQKTEAQKEPKSEMTLAAGLDSFRRLHDEILQYARTTDDDLRAHVVKDEGTDTYQWILGITAHTQRHILQIREIKSDANFPKQ